MINKISNHKINNANSPIYKSKYLKYKNKYIQLKNQQGGSTVTDNINKTDEINKILFEDEGPLTNPIVKNYFSNLDNFGVSIGHGAYKINRYESTKNILLNDKISFYKNPDVSLEFQKNQNNKYFIDINLNRLNNNHSNGTTEWFSYNWALVKKPDGNFSLIFSQSNNDESEIGIKHSYIGMENKLIFSGECRIIEANGKTLYQFNTNSSSAPSYDIPGISYQNYGDINKFILAKIKKVLSLFLTNLTKEEIQLVGHDSNFNKTGLNNSDPTTGLLYYYLLKSHSANEEKYKLEINNLAYQIHAYNKQTEPNKRILYTPLIEKDEINKNLVYIQLNQDDSISLKKRPDNEYDFAINAKHKTLEYLDELFINFGLNKEYDLYGQKIKFDFGLATPSHEYNYEGVITPNTDFIKNLRPKLDNYFNNYCEYKEGISWSPSEIDLSNIKCLTNAKGSGSTLLYLGDKIIKSYPLTDDGNINKFWSEGWISDFIERKISNAFDNGLKVTDGFVKFYDIFQCPKLAITDNEGKCSNYITKGNYGNIMMEKIDGTLGDIPDDSFDCGVLFEYLYAKLVAFKIANIIFTDQVNTGNCGYKTVDYCRKYTLNQAGETLTIYITNTLMVKVFDFDNFVLTNKTNSFFGDISDILPDGGGLFNWNNDFVGFDDITKKITTYFKEKVKKSETLNFLSMIFNFRKAHKDNNQVVNFLTIINKTIPQSYKVPPTGDIRIESYNFTIS